MAPSEQDAALLALVTRFAARLELVRALIRDVRPHLLARVGGDGGLSRERMLATSTGTWGPADEWEFHMHGLGCKLVHRVTGEPLDWDAPDLRRFDLFCFLRWLEWCWEQPDGEPDAAVLRRHFGRSTVDEALRNALERLVEHGALRRGRRRGNTYEIVP